MPCFFPMSKAAALIARSEPPSRVICTGSNAPPWRRGCKACTRAPPTDQCDQQIVDLGAQQHCCRRRARQRRLIFGLNESSSRVPRAMIDASLLLRTHGGIHTLCGREGGELHTEHTKFPSLSCWSSSFKLERAGEAANTYRVQKTPDARLPVCPVFLY